MRCVRGASRRGVPNKRGVPADTYTHRERERARQAPATAATHRRPKRLSGPSSLGVQVQLQSPPELARRDLPSTLSSVLRDGKGWTRTDGMGLGKPAGDGRIHGDTRGQQGKGGGKDATQYLPWVSRLLRTYLNQRVTVRELETPKREGGKEGRRR